MIRKVAIVYPPLPLRGFPHLTQNRWFHLSLSGQSRIQPLVASSAATLFSSRGYQVLYLDGINGRISPAVFMRRFLEFGPDIAVMEAKTPVIGLIWDFIRRVRGEIGTRFVLVGDHVSFFPAESLRESPADYCVTGGDYDTGLLGLVESLNGAGEMPAGVWYRRGSEIRDTGPFRLCADLDQIPFIDRDLTCWRLYGEAYLRSPCAYILSGRGCRAEKGAAGGCTFCSWQYGFWRCSARARSPGNVAEEAAMLVDRYGVREIFDDNESGMCGDAAWLEKFLSECVKRGLTGRVAFSSNARAASLDGRTCGLLKRIGYRLLKIGVESGNDETLLRIGKRETRAMIEAGVRSAKDHGLRVLLTLMIGYPWETEQNLSDTYEWVRKLFLYKPRMGDGLQVSLLTPYPGTPLHREACREGWFSIDPSDYGAYDMSRPILKGAPRLGFWGKRYWGLYTHPAYLFRSALTLRSLPDLKLALDGMASLLTHAIEWKRIAGGE